jgi:hypothetical protein
MILTKAGLPDLGRHRALFLYAQSPAEARLVRQLSDRLRQARLAGGCGRQQFAAALGVELALLVAVENGYGCPALARQLVDAAERLPPHPAPPEE